MPRNYYYLVSGLKEYTLDSDTKGLDTALLRDEIMEALSLKDKELLTLFCYFYDITNIINFLQGRTTRFNTLGNLSKEEVGDIVEAFRRKNNPSGIEEEESTGEKKLPGYLKKIFTAYKEGNQENGITDDDGIRTRMAIDNALWTAYYDKATHSSNPFLKEWYAFDRDIRNISAAYTARAKWKEITPNLIGNNEITQNLAQSNANDFGLKDEFGYIDELVQILETKDILSKERKLDVLRWDKINDMTTFDYFNINMLLGYMAKLSIINRWIILDKETGREMFNKLIGELTDEKLLSKEI